MCKELRVYFHWRVGEHLGIFADLLDLVLALGSGGLLLAAPICLRQLLLEFILPLGLRLRLLLADVPFLELLDEFLQVFFALSIVKNIL